MLNIFGIYIDTEVIQVCALPSVDAEAIPVLTMPAVYIFTEWNEVLTGERAVRYQKCHKKKQLHSVLGFMKDSERFQSQVITESAKENCRVLMRELKKKLDTLNKFHYDPCCECVVIASSDLKVKRAVVEAMREVGFTVQRSLQPASAYAIAKTFRMNDSKQRREFAMCVTANGERQYVRAEYSDSILELLENRTYTDSDRASYLACDEKVRRELGLTAASYENLAIEAAKGAAYEGLILRKADKAKMFLCLDMFPWKLGIEILGKNQEVCCPLTWIIDGQPSIPVKRMTDNLALREGVKGELLRLYAAKDGAGNSADVIKQWDLTGVDTEWKQAEAGISINSEHLEIQIEMKIDGKEVTASFLSPKPANPKETPNCSFTYVPKQVLKQVQNASETFAAGVSRLDAGQLDDPIGKGLQMFARQSEELAGFCKTAGDTVYVSAFIERLLLMADNLEYGIKGVQKTDFLRKYSDESSLLYAFYDELKKNLKKLNVTPVEADGMYFDPYVHDAMLAEQIEGVEPDLVIEQIQKGYYVGDKLFRAAKVKVSK